MATKHILVTGGTGYIGAHTVVLLVEAGWQVTVIDNLANSNEECLARVGTITRKPEATTFQKCDLRDKDALRAVFASNKFEAVIHFAGYKAVGESRQNPMLYYSNNVQAAVVLLEVMAENKVKTLIFSSSCTVYGESPSPLTEQSPVGFGITNAYARSKFIIEEMIRDVYASDPSWNMLILRYFNPVGAHPSGLIGEDPRGIPNCLMPYVLQVLVGRLSKLTVYGSDYDTRDGTPIRDYIHVVDVARGHLDALAWIDKAAASSASASGAGKGVYEVFNFGTGTGTTVFELVAAMERASGMKVALEVGPRRPGDLTASYADPAKAAAVLGWKCEYDIDAICQHAWLWQSNNPLGFSKK